MKVADKRREKLLNPEHWMQFPALLQSASAICLMPQCSTYLLARARMQFAAQRPHENVMQLFYLFAKINMFDQ